MYPMKETIKPVIRNKYKIKHRIIHKKIASALLLMSANIIESRGYNSFYKFKETLITVF
jgi:hypothetical protein